MKKVIKFPCITRMKIPKGNIERVITGKIIVWLENYMPCEFDMEPQKLSLKNQNIGIRKKPELEVRKNLRQVIFFSCFLKDEQVVSFIRIQVWLFLVKNKCNVMLMVANDCLLCVLVMCRAGGILFFQALT